MKYILLVMIITFNCFANESIAHCKEEKAKIKPACKTMICEFINKTKLEISEVNTEELVQIIHNKKENFYLVDLRDAVQFERGRILYDNLINIDRGHVEMKIEDEIKDKNANIILYCCTGRRSALTAKTLQEMGYKNVRSYSGGMIDWASKGNPISTEYGVMRLTKE